MLLRYKARSAWTSQGGESPCCYAIRHALPRPPRTENRDATMLWGTLCPDSTEPSQLASKSHLDSTWTELKLVYEPHAWQIHLTM